MTAAGAALLLLPPLQFVLLMLVLVVVSRRVLLLDHGDGMQSAILLRQEQQPTPVRCARRPAMIRCAAVCLLAVCALAPLHHVKGAPPLPDEPFPGGDRVTAATVTLARLQGGSNALQGRLEIQMGGAWSAVCSAGFGLEEARVACRQAGLAGGAVSNTFPSGRLPIAVANVVCRGNEPNLAACKYSLTSACPGGKPAGLVCQKPAIVAVRLVRTQDQSSFGRRLAGYTPYAEPYTPVPGTPYALAPESGFDPLNFPSPSPYSPSPSPYNSFPPAPSPDEGLAGRVEVLLSGNRWGTVCGTGFSDAAAQVVCRMAGLSGGQALRAGAYGAGNDPVRVGALKCNGGERNLTLCQYALQPDCDHSRDAAVQCTTPPPMPLRLVNGKRTRDYKGRLEVKIGGRWGTVCSAGGFNAAAARAVCAKLGLQGGRLHLGSDFGTTSLPILLAGVSCANGREPELSACLYSTNTAKCKHGQDVGVVCSRPSVESITLTPAKNVPSGFAGKQAFAVVKLISGKYSKVCRDGVTNKEARVICAQAGLVGGTLLPSTVVEPSSIVGYDRLLTNLRCQGSELSLTGCKYELGGVCPSGKSVAVRCALGKLTKVRLVGGTSARSGRVEVMYGRRWVSVCPGPASCPYCGLPASVSGRAICRQLGLDFSKLADFGVGTTPIAIGDFFCESPTWAVAPSLQGCSFTTSASARSCLAYNGTGRRKPLGVVCTQPKINAVSLADTPDCPNCSPNTHAFVLVGLTSGVYGKVCRDGFNAKSADVVCRQAGFKAGTLLPATTTEPESMAGLKFVVGSVRCAGTERYLAACPSRLQSTCASGKAAVIKCQGEGAAATGWDPRGGGYIVQGRAAKRIAGTMAALLRRGSTQPAKRSFAAISSRLSFVLLMLMLVPTLLAVSRRVLLLDHSGGGGNMQSAIFLRQEQQEFEGIPGLHIFRKAGNSTEQQFTGVGDNKQQAEQGQHQQQVQVQQQAQQQRQQQQQQQQQEKEQQLQLQQQPGADGLGGWYVPGREAALEVLTGFAGEVAHWAAAPGLRPELVAAQPAEVLVRTATAHYLGQEYEGDAVQCPYRGKKLSCRFGREVPAAAADAQWFHAPHVDASGTGLPQRAFPGQAFVVFSMEGAGYYPQVDAGPSFMGLFDYTMTYHPASDVPVIYPPFDIRTSQESSLPGFAARKAAVVYVNSNCSPLNRREQIMHALNGTHAVPVDSMGRCMHNTQEEPGGKIANMRRYRVCVAMENSNSVDYVTEKPWQAFEAGCVPLYLGAPNAAADFFPTNDSVIWVERYPEVEKLAAEVMRVLTDEAVWRRYMAWRTLPFEQLRPGYRALLGLYRLPTTRCQLCQLLADRRLLRLSGAAGEAASGNATIAITLRALRWKGDGSDSNALQGRLEIQMGGAWSAVCSAGFGLEEARVACRQAGLAGGAVSNSFPKGRLPFAVANIVCRGNEPNLAACKYSLTSACPGGKPAGLVCQKPAIVAVRLVKKKDQASFGRRLAQYEPYAPGPESEFDPLNSPSPSPYSPSLSPSPYNAPSPDSSPDEGLAGRVEVLLSGNRWGTVCGTGFSDAAAQVVCRMAGLSGGRALRAGAYGAGSDPVRVGALKCNGGERNLTLCQYALEPDCDHSRDAAVQCTTPPPMPLRLVNGKRTRDYKGRLEVKIGGPLGHCVQRRRVQRSCCPRCLGLQGGRLHLGSDFGTTSLPILLAGVSCANGREPELSACLYSTNTAKCKHGQDVGVVCSRPSVESITLTPAKNVPSGFAGKQAFAVVKLISGKYSKVCRDGVTNKEARVICAQAGLVGGTLLPSTVVEPSSVSRRQWTLAIESSPSVICCVAVDSAARMIVGYDRLLTNLRCQGSELSLTGCKYELGGRCPSGKSVAVRCASGKLTKVRLVLHAAAGFMYGGRWVSGPGPNDCFWCARQPAVEVMYGGRWVSVCPGPNDCFWCLPASVSGKTICRQLGLAFSKLADFGVGTTPFAIGDLFCERNAWDVAPSLQDCSFTTSASARSCLAYDGSGQRKPLGVVCTQPKINAVSLADTPDCPNCSHSTPSYPFGVYGKVCRDGFNAKSADVVCRQAGFKAGTLLPATTTEPESMAGLKFVVGSVRCAGTERYLAACPSRLQSTCASGKAAVIKCQGEGAAATGRLGIRGVAATLCKGVLQS
ncbi:Deleted in malignant brain tumors 1 protein [Chlorella vulgaris]